MKMRAVARPMADLPEPARTLPVVAEARALPGRKFGQHMPSPHGQGMTESLADMLAAGGKTNSLGRVSEVIELVSNDRQRLDELYDCLLEEDAWLRMRAADALEKVCRQHPDWLLPFVDRFLDELATSSQPSIQWHLAQIYSQVDLTSEQKHCAIDWLRRLLSTKNIDWIVAANAMDTLAQFTKDGSFPTAEMIALLNVQQSHKSKSVIRRANKLLAELAAS
jgi:TPR repeat protein